MNILHNTKVLTATTDQKLLDLTNKLQTYSNNIHDKIENIVKINMTNLETNLDNYNTILLQHIDNLNKLINDFRQTNGFDINYQNDILTII